MAAPITLTTPTTLVGFEVKATPPGASADPYMITWYWRGFIGLTPVDVQTHSFYSEGSTPVDISGYTDFSDELAWTDDLAAALSDRGYANP